QVAENPGADRYIIFGTCHNPIRRRFALTRKGYDTPLGCARTDTDFVDRLAATLPADYFGDEFAARNEHSIEFQAVCLRYVLGDTAEFRIAPILVGSFHDLGEQGRSAGDDAEVAAMVGAVRETMAELGGRYCVIAGADLAHVGRRF